MPDTAETRGAVHASIDGGVLHIELDRAAERNALTYPMMLEVADQVAAGCADPGVRAVLISGRGPDFCAGDTPWDPGPWPDRLLHRRSPGPHGNAPVVEQHMLRTVRGACKPVVAALRGEVLGLGLDLAAVCDFRIAAPDAEIGDPRILQGRHAATGITYVLPRLIGQSRATWLLLTGEAMGADEAHRLGFVHRLIPAETFAQEAAAFAERLAHLPTRSVAVKKEMTLAQLDLAFEAAMTHCLGVRQTNVIEDKDEGLRAWRERRPPRFTGR